MIKECLIILLLLAVLLGVIYLLYATGVLRRRVVVTIIENLPLGIFKENNAQVQEETIKTYIQENSKSNENVETKLENDFEKEFNSESLEMLKENNVQDEEIVYWTPHGKHYHKTKNCRTLLRSKIINSGSIDESGKLTACHKCN